MKIIIAIPKTVGSSINTHLFRQPCSCCTEGNFPAVGSLSPCGGLELSKSYTIAHHVRLGSQERSTTETGFRVDVQARHAKLAVVGAATGGGGGQLRDFRRLEQRQQGKGKLQGCPGKSLATATAGTPDPHPAQQAVCFATVK